MTTIGIDQAARLRRAETRWLEQCVTRPRRATVERHQRPAEVTQSTPTARGER